MGCLDAGVVVVGRDSADTLGYGLPGESVRIAIQVERVPSTTSSMDVGVMPSLTVKLHMQTSPSFSSQELSRISS